MSRYIIRRIIVIAFLLVLTVVLIGSTRGEAAQREKELTKSIPLKILYVGQKDTKRYDDFVSFLKANFETVTAVDLKAFEEKQTKDSDIVILDSDGTGRDAFPISLSKDYSKPTISMGIPCDTGATRCILRQGIREAAFLMRLMVSRSSIPYFSSL